MNHSELYFKTFEKLSDNKFIKINKENDVFKLSIVVLSGCTNQWKKNDKIIYIPGLKVSGEKEVIQDFFSKILTEDMTTIFENSFSKNEIPENIVVYVLNKTELKFIKTDEQLNGKEYFETYSKKNVSKIDVSDLDILTKVYDEIKSKEKCEQVKQKKTEKKIVEKKPFKSCKEKIEELKENQVLDITDFKETGTGLKAITKTTESGGKSKIRPTAKYIDEKVFFYLNKKELPEGAILFCINYYGETREESMERLRKFTTDTN